MPEDEKRLHILNFLKDFKELMDRGNTGSKASEKSTSFS